MNPNSPAASSRIVTFYFNTGVRPNPCAKPPIKASPEFGQVLRDGTVQIPFQVEGVPENAFLLFLCDNPDLPESKVKNVLVAKLLPGSGMISKFAYFRLPVPWPDAAK